MPTVKPSLAISVGDLNGIGIAIALQAHSEISQYCNPIYCIGQGMLHQAAQALHHNLPHDITYVELEGSFEIQPGQVNGESGRYSFNSFMKGVTLCEQGHADALVTLPIHKEAWMQGGITYKGHTDALRDHFNAEAIMMLGCDSLYVALYTEHIPLSRVSASLEEGKLTRFLIHFQEATGAEKVGVLGLNPHAGDNGVLGEEERIIEKAIEVANSTLGKHYFVGPLVPDVAFTPHVRQQYHYMVAMYHDQGLAPLKALYFDESVNVSLNLPIIRTSVDHGTAFDIAYRQPPKLLSYINAVKSAMQLYSTQVSNRSVNIASSKGLLK